MDTMIAVSYQLCYCGKQN